MSPGGAVLATTAGAADTGAATDGIAAQQILRRLNMRHTHLQYLALGARCVQGVCCVTHPLAVICSLRLGALQGLQALELFMLDELHSKHPISEPWCLCQQACLAHSSVQGKTEGITGKGITIMLEELHSRCCRDHMVGRCIYVSSTH